MIKKFVLSFFAMIFFCMFVIADPPGTVDTIIAADFAGKNKTFNDTYDTNYGLAAIGLNGAIAADITLTESWVDTTNDGFTAISLFSEWKSKMTPADEAYGNALCDNIATIDGLTTEFNGGETLLYMMVDLAKMASTTTDPDIGTAAIKSVSDGQSTVGKLYDALNLALEDYQGKITKLKNLMAKYTVEEDAEDDFSENEYLLNASTYWGDVNDSLNDTYQQLSFLQDYYITPMDSSHASLMDTCGTVQDTADSLYSSGVLNGYDYSTVCSAISDIYSSLSMYDYESGKDDNLAGYMLSSYGSITNSLGATEYTNDGYGAIDHAEGAAGALSDAKTRYLSTLSAVNSGVSAVGTINDYLSGVIAEATWE